MHEPSPQILPPESRNPRTPIPSSFSGHCTRSPRENATQYRDHFCLDTHIPPILFPSVFFLSNLTKESAHGSIQSQKPSARETLTIARRASSHESLNPETLARNVSTGTSSKRSTRSTTKGAAETGSQRALFLPAWGPPPRHQSTRGRCTGVAERAEKRQRPRSKSCSPPGVMARAPNLLRERCRDPPMNR